jgi:hypothetical protein
MFDVTIDPDIQAIAGAANLFGLSISEVTDCDTNELMRAINALKIWYRDTCLAASHGGTKTRQINDAHPVLSLYQSMLLNSGVLPGDLDRQDPILLYKILTEKKVEIFDPDKIPKDMRPYYGL